ncbi:MAG: hypothetical protein KW806_03355 [Candidatus Yanofskybacteria bacterium]|nr:hypothetical protein [Candidatus Yanofskybacteria bacterium]
MESPVERAYASCSQKSRQEVRVTAALGRPKRIARYDDTYWEQRFQAELQDEHIVFELTHRYHGRIPNVLVGEKYLCNQLVWYSLSNRTTEAVIATWSK